MTSAAHAGQVTITIQPVARRGMAAQPVTIPVLIQVLEAFQAAINTTAAHALGRASIRNLSVRERQNHTLGLNSVGFGGLRFECAPLAAFAREESPTLFGAEEMHRITAEALAPIFERIVATVAALAVPFTRETPTDPTLAESLNGYASTLAALAIRSSADITLMVAPSGKVPTTLHADIARCTRVVARSMPPRGDVTRLTDCAITDVSAETHAFYARVPEWNDERIRFELDPDYPVAMPWDIKLDQRIIILGQPRWERGRSRNEPPTAIHVLMLMDEHENVIGHPPLHSIARIAEEIAPYG